MHKRWLRILVVTVVVLAVAFGCYRWWVSSDADWRRVEAEAKAAGFTFAHEEIVARAREREIQAPIIALAPLAESIDVRSHDRSFGAMDRLRAAVAKHADDIAKLERAVDALPEAAGACGYLLSDIPRVLAARIMTCEPDQLDASVARALRFWSSPTSTPRMLELPLRACTMRIADLKGHEAVAAGFDAACERMPAKMLLGDRLGLADVADLLHRPRTSGSTWLQSLCLRQAREEWLRAFVAMMAAESAHPDMSAWPALFPASALNPKLPSQRITRITTLRSEDVMGQWQRDASEVALHARLLAAELRGAPWPKDWFDPAGGPLHRIERDGKLIGAYSLGENAVDDGGDNPDGLSHGKDLCWRLYEELGVPNAKLPAMKVEPVGVVGAGK